MPGIDAPPPFCDLVWRAAGPARFTAARTPLYDAAVTCAGASLEAAGFDIRTPRATLDLTGCRDVAALAKRMSIWTGAARKRLDFEQARDAALRPPAAELQAGLVDLVRTAAWAFGSRLDLAYRFAAAGNLTRRQAEWARDILASAQSAIASADARLTTEAGAEAMERAYREDIRHDLLQAYRALSALDADRCREANGMGWGAVASAPGHRLAGMANLTPLQAAHAWALVHPHRRQLAPDLRERLFGAVLVPC